MKMFSWRNLRSNEEEIKNSTVISFTRENLITKDWEVGMGFYILRTSRFTTESGSTTYIMDREFWLTEKGISAKVKKKSIKALIIIT